MSAEPAHAESVAQSHVRQAPWFRSLAPELQQLVLHQSRLRAVVAGTVVARRGAIPQSWTGVVRGVLKASGGNSDGRVSSYLLALPSQWIDGEELVQGVPRLHDVIAVSDSIVVTIDAGVFQRLLRSNLEFCAFVLQQVSGQHRRLMQRADSGRSLSKTAWVAQTVAELAHEIGERRTGTGTVGLSQEDIAEFVGLSRQTVNQVLRELADEGWLRTRYGRVEVIDMNALRKLA